MSQIYFPSLSNPGNYQKDVVIVAVPWVKTPYPLMAPAVLKPIVEKAGLSCLAVDINGELQQLIAEERFHTDQLPDIEKFFFENHCSPKTEKFLLEVFSQISLQIISFNPMFVGLSALAYPERNSIKWIAYFLKKLRPGIKIIIGGAGVIGTNFTGRSEFVEELIANGIVDYHIRGDAEHSLYELLKGNENYTGINDIEWKELSREDLARLPIPDYSDYNFDSYKKKALGVLGSRGCVRACTYCDYIENWKKFTWRTADDVFAEMDTQNKKHGIREFLFQDALVNGNLKEFNRLMEMMARHNAQYPSNSFSWHGMIIFRDVTSSSEQEWKNIAASGTKFLAVGIESLAEHVRYHMGKKFSNKSIEFHLEQAQKHGIKINMLMIVGYITETQQDIEHAKRWLIENTRFKDIIRFTWGATLGILENTYLLRNEKQLGIKIHALGPYWTNEAIGSTPLMRTAWLKELSDLSKQLGYVVMEDQHADYITQAITHAKNQ